MKGEEAAQGEPAKVSPQRWLLVKATAPAGCTPPHPIPHGLPHSWAPRAPIPVLQDPG